MDLKNRHAKLKDISRVHGSAVFEANLTASAMVTILCNMLIDKGILVKGEVDAYLSDDRIRETREDIRQFLMAINER